jgi:hypothetical protein
MPVYVWAGLDYNDVSKLMLVNDTSVDENWDEVMDCLDDLNLQTDELTESELNELSTLGISPEIKS